MYLVYCFHHQSSWTIASANSQTALLDAGRHTSLLAVCAGPTRASPSSLLVHLSHRSSPSPPTSVALLHVAAPGRNLDCQVARLCRAHLDPGMYCHLASTTILSPFFEDHKNRPELIRKPCEIACLHLIFAVSLRTPPNLWRRQCKRLGSAREQLTIRTCRNSGYVIVGSIVMVFIAKADCCVDGIRGSVYRRGASSHGLLKDAWSSDQAVPNVAPIETFLPCTRSPV